MLILLLTPFLTLVALDPHVPVADAHVHVAATHFPDLPDTLGGALQGPTGPQEAQPEAQPAVAASRRVVVYSIPSCGICRKMKSQAIDPLYAKGWKTSQIQYVPNYTGNNISRFPTTIVYEGNKEISRVSGYLSSFELADLYHPPSSAARWRVTVKGTQVDGDAFILKHYRRNWTFPGTIQAHLLTHGVKASEIKGISTAKLVKLHSALHDYND